MIRRGTVVDGTGAGERRADVAIVGDRIVEVGDVDKTSRREISADEALVTPGWVDVHTHYDGQATWNQRLAPSSVNGVTTVVMGNCGVGFAQVLDSDHQRSIELMEGVEDIPGAALHEGRREDGTASASTSMRWMRFRTTSISPRSSLRSASAVRHGRPRRRRRERNPRRDRTDGTARR